MEPSRGQSHRRFGAGLLNHRARLLPEPSHGVSTRAQRAGLVRSDSCRVTVRGWVVGEACFPALKRRSRRGRLRWHDDNIVNNGAADELCGASPPAGTSYAGPPGSAAQVVGRSSPVVSTSTGSANLTVSISRFPGREAARRRHPGYGSSTPAWGSISLRNLPIGSMSSHLWTPTSMPISSSRRQARRVPETLTGPFPEILAGHREL